jgi:hypothetical protein
LDFFRRGLIINCLAFVLFLILAAGFFFEILENKHWLTEDFIAQNLPNRFYADKEIRQGFIPLWNPHMLGGAPFQADIQTGVLYPLNLVLSLFPKNGIAEFYELYQSQIIFHFTLASWFTFIFLRKLNLDFLSSVLGGAVYAFGGFFFSHAHHANMVHSGIWLPAVFYCCLKGFEDDSRWIWVCPLLLAISLLGGHPQMTLFICYAFSLFYIFLVWEKSDLIIFYLVRFVAIIVSFLLLSAVQILPTAEFLNQTARNSMDFSGAVTDSLPISALWSFLLPDWNIATYESWQRWEFRNYLGVGTVFLAICGILNSPKNIGRFFCAVGILALVLSFGENTPIYKLFYDFAPGFSFFRVPARFLMILTFCLAVLAAFGCSDFTYKSDQVNGGKDLKRRGIYSGIFILGLIFLAPIPEKLPADFMRGQFNNSLIIVGLIFLFYLGKIYFPRWGRLCTLAILVVVLTDIFTYRPIFNQQQAAKENFIHGIKANPVLKLAENLPKNTRFLIRRKNLILGNWGLVYGFSNVAGYNPFKLKSYSQLDLNSRKFLNLLGVKFTDDFDGKTLVKKFPNQTHFKVINGFLENEEAYSRAFFVTESRTVDSFDLRRALKKEQFNPLEVVYLEGLPALTQLDKVTPVYHISKLENNGGRISLELHTDKKGYLVISEMYYPGWKAAINGDETKVLKADSIFRAISIEKNVNKVKLWFEPFSFVIGAWISGLTFLTFIFLFSFPKFFSQRQ